MAVPAHLAASGHLLHIPHAACLNKLCIKLLVATDTVIHHYLTCERFGLDGMMLHVTYEISSVLQAVDRLETVIDS